MTEMVNVGVVLLVLLTFIVLAGAGLFVYYAISEDAVLTDRSDLPLCSSVVDRRSLTTIPDVARKCSGTSYYYIGNVGPGSRDYVVAPFKSSALDVCVGFCDVYKDGSCTGSNYAGVSSQVNFDRCMRELSRTDCIPPVPVAIRGNTMYYPFSPTSRICQ